MTAVWLLMVAASGCGLWRHERRERADRRLGRALADHRIHDGRVA